MAGDSHPSAPRQGYPVHDEGDAWVQGPHGERYWGRFGAAGLLLTNPSRGRILLQHRVGWSHFGGTWGIPGGARHRGETAQAAAIREANEEAGVPVDSIVVRSSSTLDLGFWSYVTVIAHATVDFEPRITDAESVELRWTPLDAVAEMPLHPGFAEAWPNLRTRLA